jgi:hypothetical protein
VRRYRFRGEARAPGLRWRARVHVRRDRRWFNLFSTETKGRWTSRTSAAHNDISPSLFCVPARCSKAASNSGITCAARAPAGTRCAGVAAAGSGSAAAATPRARCGGAPAPALLALPLRRRRERRGNSVARAELRVDACIGAAQEVPGALTTASSSASASSTDEVGHDRSASSSRTTLMRCGGAPAASGVTPGPDMASVAFHASRHSRAVQACAADGPPRLRRRRRDGNADACAK